MEPGDWSGFRRETRRRDWVPKWIRTASNAFCHFGQVRKKEVASASLGSSRLPLPIEMCGNQERKAIWSCPRQHICTRANTVHGAGIEKGGHSAPRKKRHMSPFSEKRSLTSGWNERGSETSVLFRYEGRGLRASCLGMTGTGHATNVAILMIASIIPPSFSKLLRQNEISRWLLRMTVIPISQPS